MARASCGLATGALHWWVAIVLRQACWAPGTSRHWSREPPGTHVCSRWPPCPAAGRDAPSPAQWRTSGRYRTATGPSLGLAPRPGCPEPS
eukprot:412014-Lingulodinium_polyedra.AAC.1